MKIIMSIVAFVLLSGCSQIWQPKPKLYKLEISSNSECKHARYAFNSTIFSKCYCMYSVKREGGVRELRYLPVDDFKCENSKIVWHLTGEDE